VRPTTAPNTATTFRARLLSALTDADRRDSDRERKRGVRVNLYRLGHYLAAADELCEDIGNGADPATAFRTHFNPTSDMHRVARSLGLALEVDRGRWVKAN
jgi:hypothetical protein